MAKSKFDTSFNFGANVSSGSKKAKKPKKPKSKKSKSGQHFASMHGS
jgi:hypothetical protein